MGKVNACFRSFIFRALEQQEHTRAVDEHRHVEELDRKLQQEMEKEKRLEDERDRLKASERTERERAERLKGDLEKEKRRSGRLQKDLDKAQTEQGMLKVAHDALKDGRRKFEDDLAKEKQRIVFCNVIQN